MPKPAPLPGQPAGANADAQAGAALPTLQCFKAGSHVALNGAALVFSQADLAASAGAYDPALHEAPLVVGHPQLDAPAYGWVSALNHKGDALEATPAQVNPEFAELVKAGAYKKMSAAFWAPLAPGNPVPGVYYLRHVGFLGAAAPAVKGLRAPVFAGTEEGVVEFSEEFSDPWDDLSNASLWRSLREWVIGKFSLADADSAVPAYRVSELERAAQDDMRGEEAEQAQAAAAATPATPAPTAFASPTTENTVTEQEKLALEAENARLRQQIEDNANAARQARLSAAHADAVAFADGLVSQARLAAGQRDLVVAVLDTVAAQEVAAGAVVQFGQGEAAAPLMPALKTMLSGMPPLAPMGRQATNERAALNGGAVDVTDQHAIARAAQEYQRTEFAAGREVSIAQAVTHVMRQAGG